MAERHFMLVREVAELLKVGEVTVRHWIRAGDLRAIDLGREWRVASDDLDEFIDRHANRPAMAGGNGKTPERKA